jgi:ribose 5-phosphate isomerase A
MDAGKRAAGEFAATLVESDMTLGLGTGSTVEHFLRALGERVRSEGLDVRGVPTSRATEESAARHGIPTIALGADVRVDLAVDGADEIDPAFDLIKGGGGALLREKIVAHAARRVVIVADASKVVKRLGAFPLPIEVVPFAAEYVRRLVEPIAPCRLRAKQGTPFTTDNGNRILDASFGPNGIADAAETDRRLRQIPGVVETGLFVGMVDEIVIGHDDGRVERRAS